MAAAPDLFVDAREHVSPELALVDAFLAEQLRNRLRLHDELTPLEFMVGVDAVSNTQVEPLEDDEALVRTKRAVESMQSADDLIIGLDEVREADETQAEFARWPSFAGTGSSTPKNHGVDTMESAHDLVMEAVERPEEVLDEAKLANSQPQIQSHHEVDGMESLDDLILDVGHAREQAHDGSQPRSSLPILPAPEPGLEASGETEFALRAIRERLSVEPKPHRRRVWIRRRFVVASAATAACALAVFGVNVQYEAAQLPAWLPV
jgi:hypothetical protein